MDLFSTFLIGFRSKWSDEQMFRRKQQFLEIYDPNYISFFSFFPGTFSTKAKKIGKKQNCFGADELKFLKTEGKEGGSSKLLDNGMQVQRVWVQAVPVMGGCNASSWQPTPLDVHALRQFWFMSEPGWRHPLLTDGTPEASGYQMGPKFGQNRRWWVLTELEEWSQKVEGSNLAAGIGFFHLKTN